jgi:hypothetical protein
MAHYSEMNFLFSDDNRTKIIDQIETMSRGGSDLNTHNIFDDTKIVVYKSKTQNPNIKNYIKNTVYKYESDNKKNPYIQILDDFGIKNSPSPGLIIKASDLAYLKELGVYPMNRMVILRRFPEGCFVPNNLDEEMKVRPISTIIGWIPPDKNFGSITFNETWGVHTERFDQLIGKILKDTTGIDIAGALIPIPDFAQGILFEFYKHMKITDQGGSEDVDDEGFILSDGKKVDSYWDYNNLPIGDPNVLREGPFRDPDGQNILSSFSFEFDTTYEQKLIGDVDPGSAMLDIIDNIYAMGTSNMKFYWSDNSPMIKAAKNTAKEGGNDIEAWWRFVKEFMSAFWEGMIEMLKGGKETLNRMIKDAKDKNNVEKQDSEAATIKKEKEDIAAQNKINNYQSILKRGTDITTNPPKPLSEERKKWYNDEIKKLQDSIASSDLEDELNPAAKVLEASGVMVDVMIDFIKNVADTILASTAYIHRFKIRGGIELMVGGKDSSTPWYLTIGNPYSPWLASNHIKVKTATIETSMEMGYNDQPQWIKATFSCEFTRNLGKQELMRMFNNTFKRTYKDPSKLNKSDSDAIDISRLAPKTPKDASYGDETEQSTDNIISNQNKIYQGGTLPEVEIIDKAGPYARPRSIQSSGIIIPQDTPVIR